MARKEDKAPVLRITEALEKIDARLRGIEGWLASIYEDENALLVLLSERRNDDK